MKNFFQEFKQFAMRGNVIDLAIGIIIGGAFQKIISSLVGDIAMPAFNPVLGGLEFKDIHLGSLAVGNFIEATLDFVIIAFFLFLAIKIINNFKKDNPKTEEVNKQEQLLTEIRDLLKK
ncbi:large conductance mechanosensitive channel protein MscL [Candidatus Nomurabacteria bacterium]|nr:large conductance mechanosensitive channel protein MscL [Candidatus Nomurabacteria bacterium]